MEDRFIFLNDEDGWVNVRYVVKVRKTSEGLAVVVAAGSFESTYQVTAEEAISVINKWLILR